MVTFSSRGFSFTAWFRVRGYAARACAPTWACLQSTLKDVDQGFWSHLGCSWQHNTIFNCQSIFQGALQNAFTVEPWFNEVTRDRPNFFVKWRVLYIENLDIMNLRGIDQNVLYIKVIVNDWYVTQGTSVTQFNDAFYWKVAVSTIRVIGLTVCLFSSCLLSSVDIVIRYIEVDFMSGLPDYVLYIEELVISRFVISRFYSTHFTVTLAGT